jgi:hypothetical protein
MSEPRHYTVVTMPMRRRMRQLRAGGLSAEATARVIAIDFNLPQPPCRECVEAHAPKPPDVKRRLSLARSDAVRNLRSVS